MPKKVLEVRSVTIPHVKEILDSIGEEHLDQFQRRSLDYSAKFSKVDVNTAEELLTKLTDEFGIETEEAVQIINCFPETIEELRTFLAGGRKIVETQKLEEVLTLLRKYRKKD